MDNLYVHFLGAARIHRRHDDFGICHPFGRTPAFAEESNGHHAPCTCGGQRIDYADRVAASAKDHEDITGLAVCLYLPCKDLIVAEIVGNATHRERIDAQ